MVRCELLRIRSNVLEMRRNVPLVMALLLAAACGAPAAPLPSATGSATPAASTSPSRDATPSAPAGGANGWTTDINRLVPRMDALHPQLDHGVPLTDLNAAATDL